MTQNKNQYSNAMADEKGLIKGSLVQRFIASEQGTTAIEYALIAGGLSIVILATVQLIGVNLNTLFVSVESGF